MTTESLVDSTDPAGQVSGETSLAEQGIPVSDGEEEVAVVVEEERAGAGASDAESESGSSEEEEDEEEDGDEGEEEVGGEEEEEEEEDEEGEEARDRMITDFLNENPQIVTKMLAEGKYCLENLVRQHRGRVARVIEQDFEKFAEVFAAAPQAIDSILDEEACLLHNFLQNNQQALNHYLQVKPQALAAYFEQHPTELNRLFYKEPATLSRFCDEHPSFMDSWLQHRQATVQKYLVDHPALMWNHLRAHPAFRSGGQSWERSFTMALVIEIPEDQEFLIREPIQWILPKDRKRRLTKLKEMAARGEREVAVRGTVGGQEFIDEDIILEEHEALKLSQEEIEHLEGGGNGTQPERLKWYKGRMHHAESHGVLCTHQELKIETLSPDITIGPYQLAKSQVFKELHPELQSEGGSDSATESAESENTDTEDSSEDEHTDHQDNDSDSDNDNPPAQQPPPPPSTQDPDSDEPDSSEQQNMTESDSDTPLSTRRGRRNRRPTVYKDEDDDFFADLESNDSDDESKSENLRTHHTSRQKRPPNPTSQNGMKWIRKDFGGKRVPMLVPVEDYESESEESDHFSDVADESGSEDPDDDSVPDRAFIEYPAPFDLIEASKSEPLSGKWRLFEEDIAIGHMLNIRDEEVITGEERFRETVRRLKRENGIERSWGAVKNFWNRTGRARSGFDERKNKKAPLATSQQGKLAELYRLRAQAVHNAKLASPGPSKRPSGQSSQTSRPTTPTNSKARKTLPTPESTPSMESAEFPAKKTFSLQEVQAMQEDFQARQAAFQLNMQEQMNAQLQAQIETSNNQMAAQMEIFRKTLAAITGVQSLYPSQPSSEAANGKKRTRDESDDGADGDHSTRTVRKRKKTSPLNTENVTDLDPTSPDQHSTNQLMHDRSRYDAERVSDQKSRGGDHIQLGKEKRNGNTKDNIEDDLSHRSWQAGVRDRSKMRLPKYH